jgi:hypothetical protein
MHRRAPCCPGQQLLQPVPPTLSAAVWHPEVKKNCCMRYILHSSDSHWILNTKTEFNHRVSICGESRDGAKKCHVPLPVTILSLLCTQLTSRVGTAGPLGNTVWRNLCLTSLLQLYCALALCRGNSYTMVQVISDWSLTTKTPVQFQASPCGICGGQIGTQSGFSPSALAFPLSIRQCSTLSFIHHQLYIMLATGSEVK